jgi:DNA modification methylase
MNRVGMPDYMLFFRAPGENPDRIEHCAPGDERERVKIARKYLEHMRREGLVREVPDDAALAALIPHVEFDVYEWQRLASPVWMNIQQGNVLNNFRQAKGQHDEKHVCPLQLDVIENCLRLYSKPGDVVMDPFNGIGSTGYVAIKMLRRYLGFELKPEYAEQAGRNLAQAEAHAGDLFGAVA